MKLKVLPSSLRDKKRYVAFKINCDEEVSREALITAISREGLNFLGENLFGDLNLWVMDYNEAKQEGFLVCRRDKLGEVKACLSLISEIDNRRASIRILGVSGTIKALKRKFLNEEFVNEKGSIKVYGRKMRVIRRCGDLVDALPQDEDLNKRLKKMKMRYIGLTKEDIVEEV